MRIALTGGGTAGHISPAIAIAKTVIKDHSPFFIYIGNALGYDQERVTRHGIDFYGIPVNVPSGTFSKQQWRSIKDILRGIFTAKRILKKEKIDVVIGTGGFVSIPVIIAARLLRLPIYLEEQNVVVGKSNRWLSRWAVKIFLTFEQSIDMLPSRVKSRAVTVGLPLLNMAKKRTEDTYKRDIEQKIRLAVLGGSNGSIYLNDLMLSAYPMLEDTKLAAVIHSAGPLNMPIVEQELVSGRHQNMPFVQVVPYVDDMISLLEQTDVVVARAGSSTIFEILAAGLPAIIIPSPNVAEDHQRKNCLFLKASHAAIVLEESETTPEKITACLRLLFSSPEKLLAIKRQADQMAVEHAADKIMNEILGQS